MRDIALAQLICPQVLMLDLARQEPNVVCLLVMHQHSNLSVDYRFC